MFSEENLDIVPRYTNRVAYLGSAIRRQEANYCARNGVEFSFHSAFWTPPLAPRQAFRLEEKQIQRALQLPALVSLTDHDDYRAAALLRVMPRFLSAPISTEWTIPYRQTFFHLGVHNLPPERLPELQASLTRYTGDPVECALGPILERLQAIPDLLLVFNHPLWDEKGIGRDLHRSLATDFLHRYHPYIHALELNGIRSWRENRDVLALGEAVDLPVISGGDRHGREPNAILNLTEARSFAQFAAEIRERRESHVLFMPQYREPLRWRVLQTTVDAVRAYPENIEGRRLWSDRVFYRDPVSGVTTPLSAIWPDGGPRIIRHFIAAMGLVRWPGIRKALRMALVERSNAWSDGEASV